MALIKCKECKKELSSTAKMCPNCGEITEYGRNSKKKLVTTIITAIAIVTAIIICDQTAILKRCNGIDEKRGNICVKKHYSDALVKEECGSGLYVKDGRCYLINGNIKAGFPTKKYYCNEGYLDEDYALIHKCVVETTYDASYKFGE